MWSSKQETLFKEIKIIAKQWKSTTSGFSMTQPAFTPHWVRQPLDWCKLGKNNFPIAAIVKDDKQSEKPPTKNYDERKPVKYSTLRMLFLRIKHKVPSRIEDATLDTSLYHRMVQKPLDPPTMMSTSILNLIMIWISLTGIVIHIL